jgi:hypothetical protein
MDDLRRLARHVQTVLVEDCRLLKALDAGALEPVPLLDDARSDLNDCGRTVVAVEGGAEHRIRSAGPMLDDASPDQAAA